MDFPAEQTLLQIPEFAHLSQHGLTVEQELRQCRQEQLRESEERFRLFSDNVTDYALVPVDTAGNVSGWNTGAERTFGYPEAEIVGQPVRLFFTPEDREKGESEKDLRRALAQGRAED